MIFIEWYIFAFILNMLAGTITVLTARKHGPECEGNPIARFVIRKKIPFVLPMALAVTLYYLYLLVSFLGSFIILVVGYVVTLAFGLDLLWDILSIPRYWGSRDSIITKPVRVEHVPNIEVVLALSGVWKLM